MWNGAPRNRLGAALRAFDEVWVNNRDQEANFRAAVPKATIVTVSPFHGETVTVARPARPAGTPIRCVVAEGVTHDALIERGTNVASDAVALLRQRDVAAELIIVLYGGDADAITERSAELRNRCTELRINLSEGEVSALLEDTDVLLRPRDIDGDSILVREALARGCRVVASDGIPRPKGCELVPVEAAAIADALEHGGPVSDGSAMGITALNALANALAERS
jgi:glycosyltransferase involved in cell wall biosynthesis